MMNSLRSINGPLGRRIVAYVILISTIISIITSGIQIFSEFQRDIDNVNAGLDQIEKTHLLNITSRVWVLDMRELKTTLDSLLGIPAIRYLAVYENETILLETGEKIDDNVITKNYPLVHAHKGINNTIGNLVVKASLDEVYQHTIDRTIIIIASNMVKTFIVSFLILLIFYKMVTRHLFSISDFSKNHDPLLKHKPLELERNNNKPDELQIVVDSINDMHLRLSEQVVEVNEQKQYLYQTLNSIGDAVITTDVSGNITSMNPVAEKLTGWSLNEALKQSLKNVFKIVNVSTRKPVDNPIDKVLVTGETMFLSEHTTLISKQGAEYQIADSAAPIRDEEGEVLGMVLVFNDITEQYKLREEAQESRLNLQAIMDNSPAIIYLKDEKGRLSFVNLQFEKCFNIQRENILYKTMYDICPRHVADEMKLNDNKVWLTGEANEVEEIVSLKHGLQTFFTVRFPLLNSDNEIYAICTIATDITDKQHVDETVRKIALGVSSQIGEAFYYSLTQRLAEIFSAEYTFIGLLDEDNTQQINTVSMCIHGKIVDNLSYALESTPCKNVLDPECNTIQAYASDIQQLFPEDDMLREMAAESYIGTPLIGSDGRYIGLIVVIDIKPMHNVKRMHTIMQIFAARATAELERSKAEETLRINEKKYQTLAKVAPVGIYYTDHKGACLYVNEKWSDITGASANSALGEGWVQNLHIDDREQVFSEWKKASMENRAFKLEYRFNCKGQVRWVLGQALAEEGVNGEVVGYVGTITDITDRKEAETALRRSQKMDALGKLTGGIAHDYNNMLGVVLGYADLLKDKLNNKDYKNLDKYVYEINKAGQRSARLTEKLLSFSRYKKSSTEAIDINKVLLDAQHMLEKTLTARIDLSLDMQNDLWTVVLDESELQNAILNISINSMHAIAGNGRLTIKTSNQVINSIHAQRLHIDAGEYVLLTITDNGCGMDAQTKDQMFDPFYTTKTSGTGLGLSQVYGFVERCDGTIEVESEKDKGTQLRIYFPRTMPDRNEILIEKNLNITASKGKETILVVEDEPALLELVTEILTTNGYKVHTATNGKEALEMMPSLSVDLLFTDVIMPEMDGFELLEIIQKNYPDLKVMVASGYNDTQHNNIHINKDINNLLTKPYSSSELLEMIKKLLN